MSSSEKKVYYFLKKGIFTFSCSYDPVYSREINRIVTREKGATKIVPRKDEVDDIISFFYNVSKVRVRANFFLELDDITLE